MPAAVASPTDFATPKRSALRIGPLLTTSTMALAFAAAYAGYAWCETGSAHMILPYVQGQRVLFDPLTVTLSDVPSASRIEHAVNISNCSSSEVKLIGAKSGCSCVTLDEFPIRIPPGESYSLAIRIATPEGPSDFEHTIPVFLENSGYQKVVVKIFGHVSS